MEAAGHADHQADAGANQAEMLGEDLAKANPGRVRRYSPQLFRLPCKDGLRNHDCRTRRISAPPMNGNAPGPSSDGFRRKGHGHHVRDQPSKEDAKPLAGILPGTEEAATMGGAPLDQQRRVAGADVATGGEPLARRTAQDDDCRIRAHGTAWIDRPARPIGQGSERP